MKSLTERFWENVNKSGPAPSHRPELGQCWVWAGSLDPKRRGQIAGKSAHRFSWTMHFGPIPQGQGYHGTVVRHKCDNSTCVNPEHLELGSHFSNVQDRVERCRSASGVNNGQAKLTEADVLEIRRMYAAKLGSQRNLAALFCVSQPVIGDIVRRVTWTHI